MSSVEYPLKHIRLEQLYKAGFNIADFICFAPNTLRGRKNELKKFFKKHRRISCRNFHSDERAHFKCPVRYDQNDFDTILEFCLSNNEGQNEEKAAFYTLCNEAIKLEDSTCAGNVLIQDKNSFIAEFFYGKGTPRDIDLKPFNEIKSYRKSGYLPAEGDKPSDDVLRFIKTAKDFKAFADKPYLLEFSVYPYPIGKRQTNVICWEWRWGA